VRWAARIVTPVIAMPAVLALTATGAQAHATVAYHGMDFVSVASNHRYTSVCDRENDGNSTTADYEFTDGTRKAGIDKTTNGDCQEYVWSREIRRYKVCEFNRLEEILNCGSWRNT
jgi:hypothetical protein